MGVKSSFNHKGIRLYQVKPNYPTRKAIKEHPDLINHLKSRYPPRIQKNNRDTLKLYNKYIAKDLYDLSVEFYPEAIIPSPIMRYHFLKHVICHDAVILEIGTGACAIIAMLAAKFFNAKVTATELDEYYLNWAKKTVKANDLQSQIDLVQSHGQMIQGLIANHRKFDFIISNPPYYDINKYPKSPWGGKTHELIGNGKFGEKFILQLISEGWEYLNPNGALSFVVPKTRESTLIAIEKFLNETKKQYQYDIIGLLVGNRTRYIFRIYKTKSHQQESHNVTYEMY